jgi:hypothetical protein
MSGSHENVEIAMVGREGYCCSYGFPFIATKLPIEALVVLRTISWVREAVGYITTHIGNLQWCVALLVRAGMSRYA